MVVKKIPSCPSTPSIHNFQMLVSFKVILKSNFKNLCKWLNKNLVIKLDMYIKDQQITFFISQCCKLCGKLQCCYFHGNDNYFLKITVREVCALS